MNTYKVTRTTKKAITVVFTLVNRKTKETSELKQVIRNYRDISNGLSWLEESDFKKFINDTKNLLTTEELEKLTKVYTPSAAQIREKNKQVQSRRDWYNNPANMAQMNREIKKMQRDPGFMSGHEITRELIDSTIDKEVQRLYNLA